MGPEGRWSGVRQWCGAWWRVWPARASEIVGLPVRAALVLGGWLVMAALSSIQADHLLPTKVLPDCLQTVNIGLNA